MLLKGTSVQHIQAGCLVFKFSGLFIFYLVARLEVTLFNLRSKSTFPFIKMAGNNTYKQWDNILKSEEDKRQYRGLQLDNGMKVLLVSDPSTDKSAAAIEVNVGKFRMSCE